MSTTLPTTLSSVHSRLDIDGAGVATLTILNARALNILSSPVITDLTAMVNQAASLASRDVVRVLVLRGSGDKAFIGGADINEMAGLAPASAEVFIRGLRGLCDAVRNVPAPTIARLCGYTLGGGLEVALACDLRIADPASHFGMPETKIGVPSVIHAVLLPRLVGQARATWMLLTGDLIDAATAEQWGLVYPLAGPGQLDRVIGDTAAALSRLGPAVLRQQKALMRSWEDQPVDQSIEATVREFGRSFATGEPQRFMAQFQRGKAEAKLKAAAK